jgi:hypothetical protein
MFSEKVMLVIFTFQLPASATGVIVTKAAAAITTVIITAKMAFFMVLLTPTQYSSMSLEAIGFANRPVWGSLELCQGSALRLTE